MESGNARVLIAGATAGFGQELARAIAAGGARLVLSGRHAAALDALGAELAATGTAKDLTAADGASQLVDSAVAILGGLDVLVASIGVVAFGPAAELDDATLEQLFAVNTLARSAWCAQRSATWRAAAPP